MRNPHFLLNESIRMKSYAGRRRVLCLPSLKRAAARARPFKRGVVGGAEALAEDGSEARAVEKDASTGSNSGSSRR